MITRTVKCDILGCTSTATEKNHGEGWKGWGQLLGIVLNGVQNPYLCPDHLPSVAEAADKLRGIE